MPDIETNITERNYNGSSTVMFTIESISNDKVFYTSSSGMGLYLRLTHFDKEIPKYLHIPFNLS